MRSIAVSMVFIALMPTLLFGELVPGQPLIALGVFLSVWATLVWRLSRWGLEFAPGSIRVFRAFGSKTFALEEVEGFDMVFKSFSDRVFVRLRSGSSVQATAMAFGKVGLLSTEYVAWGDGEKTKDVLGRLHGQLAWQREHAPGAQSKAETVSGEERG